MNIKRLASVQIIAWHDDVIKWKHFRVTGPLWGKPPVTGGFPSRWPVTRSFDYFFDLRLNKRLSKQSRRRCLGTPSRPLWRHSNGARQATLGHVKFIGAYMRHLVSLSWQENAAHHGKYIRARGTFPSRLLYQNLNSLNISSCFRSYSNYNL